MSIRSLAEMYTDVMEGRIATTPCFMARLSTKLGGGFREGQITVIGGTPGSGKTHFVIQQIIRCVSDDIPWVYQPYEGSKQDVEMRMLGHIAGSWAPTELTKEAAEQAAFFMTDDKIVGNLKSASRYVMENPNLTERQPGQMSPLNWGLVLSWVKEMANEGKRLIIIDPVSMIDFNQKYRKPYELQEEFMQGLISIIPNTISHVILVCHMSKGQDGSGSIKGSAAFQNLCDNDVRIIRHEEKTSNIYMHGGGTTEVTHDRTVVIHKARYGKTGVNLAVRVPQDRPNFVELGIIAQPEGGKKYGRN